MLPPWQICKTPVVILDHSLRPLWHDRCRRGCALLLVQVAKDTHHLTRRTVVSVDARNHGDSPHATEMSYSHLAADVRHTIKQGGGGKCCHHGTSVRPLR